MLYKNEFFSRFVDWLLTERQLSEQEVLNLSEDTLKEYYKEFVDCKLHFV